MNFDVSSEASSVDNVGSKYPIVLCALTALTKLTTLFWDCLSVFTNQ